MLTLQHSPARCHSFRTRDLKARNHGPAKLVPEARVKFLLHEIAIQMHATRVVGRKDGVTAPKKG